MAVQEQLQVPKLMYIELETPNRSFVKMRNFLKAKGITNCDFFLALFDKGLAGIDPFDPNLSSMMKARVLQECIRNFWYFIRNVVRVPHQGSATGVPYMLNRGNLAMNFLFMMNFNMFVELPRQSGKTIAAVCWYLWCFNFGTSNSQIMFMHKAHSGSKDNLKSLKDIRALLPSYLQMDGSIGNEGRKLKIPDTVIELGHPKNNNRIVTFPSARSVDSANNLGRGKTMPLEFYDEFAFMPFNKIVYEAASPAFSTAAANARANGAPYGILLTTTPGDLLTDSGQYAYYIRNSATPFNELYYDYTVAQMNELRDANTKSAFFLISYSYQQLGKGPEYFAEMVKMLLQNWATIRREVLLEWSEVATDQAFTDEELSQIKSYLKEPIRTVLFGRVGQYQFNIYEEFDLSNPPIVGVDVSGATMRDASAITVIDSTTTRAVANMHSNFIPADDLADVIYTLTVKYLPNAIINIERNGEASRNKANNTNILVFAYLRKTTAYMVTCMFSWVKTETHWSMPYLATA